MDDCAGGGAMMFVLTTKCLDNYMQIYPQNLANNIKTHFVKTFRQKEEEFQITFWMVEESIRILF